MSGDKSEPTADCWICGGLGAIINPLHRRLLESRSLLHVSTAGAGPALLRRLWSETGISEYFVGSAMPYRRAETHAFLGHAPEASYTSEDVAYDMAMASYLRAAEVKVVEGSEGHPVGLGVTSAVASYGWPNGGHRSHAVVVTKDRILHRRIDLAKGRGSPSQKAGSSRCEVYAPTRGARASSTSGAKLGRGKKLRELHDREIAAAALSLLRGALDESLPAEEACEAKAMDRFYRYPIFHSNGTRSARLQADADHLYLPATLDPIHDGHRLMARAAEEAKVASHRVVYLVSSVSPHKGKLGVQQMLQKAGMLLAERWRGELDSRTLEFTRDEPLFIDKARKRPNSIFVIGADTMRRMLDPAWGIPVEDLLGELMALGARFLVMGRYIDGKWVTCRDIPLPRWTDQFLFTPLPGRADISSTELRQRAQGDTAA